MSGKTGQRTTSLQIRGISYELEKVLPKGVSVSLMFNELLAESFTNGTIYKVLARHCGSKELARLKKNYQKIAEEFGITGMPVAENLAYPQQPEVAAEATDPAGENGGAEKKPSIKINI